MSEFDQILRELKKLRSDSLIKDVLIGVVPLLVAVISIYFSNKYLSRQIEVSKDQQEVTSRIETAKLLDSFSADILEGGHKAQIARIALETVPMSESQSTQLALYFESAAGGSDQPGPQNGGDNLVDKNFADLLSKIFSKDKSDRITGYIGTHAYLLNNSSVGLIEQMIAKIDDNPFNINGRSNALSILASLPEARISSSKNSILAFLSDLEIRGKNNPAYAVGPNTQGWIRVLRNNLR